MERERKGVRGGTRRRRGMSMAGVPPMGGFRGRGRGRRRRRRRNPRGRLERGTKRGRGRRR